MQTPKKNNFIMSIWKKYIKQRFFNKAFLMFFAISFLAGIVLLIVLSNNLVTIKTEQALDMSNQIVDTVDIYLNDKLSAAQAIQQRLIRDDQSWSVLCNYLKDTNSDMGVDEYAKIRQTIAQNIYAVDNQFYSIFLYGLADKSLLRLSSDSDATNISAFLKRAQEGGTQGGTLVAAHNQYVDNNAFFMLALSSINDPEMFTREIGVMGLSFNAMNVKQSYRRLESYLKGPLLVLDKDGNILYDSRALYTLPEGFLFEKLPFEQDAVIHTKKYISNSRYNAQGNYYVVNLIPTAEVRHDVVIVSKSISFIIITVILAALVLTFYSSLMFSRRLKKLSETMELVRGGQLTGLGSDMHDDEIGSLHAEFLSVCSSLDEHIQREYIYQLRQKEMEIYALQAQIDPHFLYNTLEAVRMKLLLSGEEQISRMIRVMSEVFRNIMKKDMVVSVRDELVYLQSYLELYKFRLGDKLEYSFEIDEGVYAYSTIKHILQPIVENCLLHGFKDVTGEGAVGRILVAAWKDEGDIVYIVRDNGQGIPEEQLSEMKARLEADKLFQQSVGIYNVNSRLRIIYGDKYRLQMASNSSGTEVLVRIKAMVKKELEEYVQSSTGGRRANDT